MVAEVAGGPILAIAAPVRGEARYIVEWIAYHRALGIRLFILADHGGIDDTSRILHELHDRKIIWRLDWLDRKASQMAQMAFNGLALNLAARFADGLFLIDVDEFLRPQAATDAIPDIAVRWLSDPGIGAVMLNWAIYGSSGRVEPGEGLVIERFIRRAPQQHSANCIGKTFVRLAACQGPDNPHAVTLRDGYRYVDTRGQNIAWDTTKGFEVGITRSAMWDVLRLDHFIIKSRAEFAAKRARGSFRGRNAGDW